jgi:hypothetical protein
MIDKDALTIALLGEGRKTANELAEKLKTTSGAMRAMLNKLRKAGKVSREPGKAGRWKLYGAAFSPPREETDPDQSKRAPFPEGGNPHFAVILQILKGGPIGLEHIARAAGLGHKETGNLLQRMKRAEDVEVTGTKRGAKWHLPGDAPKASHPVAKRSTRFAKGEKMLPADPLVALLLERRGALEAEIERVDRMIRIAEEG